MIIYHGSTDIVEYPRIIESELGRDFGAGFYTTDIKEQAIRWAKHKLIMTKRYNACTEAVLNYYEFDETAYEKLNTISFPESDYEWLDFVCACRSDSKHRHNYDIVTGKIADDNVGMTVSYVINNVMRREDAIERLRFEKINNQICFCSLKALQYLKYIKCEKVQL